MLNPTIRRWIRRMLIPVLIALFVNIAEVFSVVMMKLERTDVRLTSKEEKAWQESPPPHPYNISSKITGVPKYEFYSERSESKCTNAWMYDTDNVVLFTTQGSDKTMENRFAFDENMAKTGVSLYGVFDGYAGNFTAEYLSYVLMDKLKIKIVSIKRGKRDDHLTLYIYPNGTINYQKLLHDEVLAAEKNLWNKIHDMKGENTAWQYNRSGSALLIAVLDQHDLYVANVGESRALGITLDGVVTRLTKNHNYITNEEERARVTEATKANPDACGGSGVSRIIGDFYYKLSAPYLIPDPEVFYYNSSNFKFFLLATDGIWTGMPKKTDAQKDDWIARHPFESYNTLFVESLTNLAIRRHEQKIGGHSRTIMIVRTGLSRIIPTRRLVWEDLVSTSPLANSTSTTPAS